MLIKGISTFLFPNNMAANIFSQKNEFAKGFDLIMNFTFFLQFFAKCQAKLICNAKSVAEHYQGFMLIAE